jgi:hypothetical protein
MLMIGGTAGVWGTDRSVALTFTGTMETSSTHFLIPAAIPVLAGDRLRLSQVILVSIGVYSVIAYTARRTPGWHSGGTGANSGTNSGLGNAQGCGWSPYRNYYRLVHENLLARLIANQLRSVRKRSFTLMVITILVVNYWSLACWIPARRATRQSIIIALR